jgi:hypothetical protein
MKITEESLDTLTRETWSFHISAIGDGRIVVEFTHYWKEVRATPERHWRIVERFGCFRPEVAGEILDICPRLKVETLALHLTNDKINSTRIWIIWPEDDARSIVQPGVSVTQTKTQRAIDAARQAERAMDGLVEALKSAIDEADDSEARALGDKLQERAQTGSMIPRYVRVELGDTRSLVEGEPDPATSIADWIKSQS